MLYIAKAASVVTICLLLGGVQSHVRTKHALTDEPSREDLGEYGASVSTGVKAFPRAFKFPADVKVDQLFGIDVSHYQDQIDWDKIPAQGASFVFIKATQGADFYDPTFDRNWHKTASLHATFPRFHRGAYHFMTAVDSADLQAQNFLGTVGNGAASDLPACLDVEWDFVIRDKKPILDKQGQRIDQWANLSQGEIAQRVSRWLTLVEAATGRKPIIYTNSSWWKTRVGTTSSFQGFTFWISDFSSHSLGKESPTTLNGAQWFLWQLTDQGEFTKGGITKMVDATVYHGSLTDFEAQFGIR